MSSKTHVSQIELAAELRLTDRRIRQMTDQWLLPPPHHERGYDLDRCKKFYKLYRDGSVNDWSRFYDEALADAEHSAAEFERAMSDKATLDDIKQASAAVQRDEENFCFISAARSRSQPEREFFLPLWHRQANEALSLLLSRAMELLGKTHLVNEATGEVTEVIRASAQRRPVSRQKALTRRLA